MKSELIIVSLSLALLSCKITHNIPQSQTPNKIVSENTFNIFVDQNGNFFPNFWEKNYGKHKKRGAYSLNTLAIQNSMEDSLKKSESQTLRDIKNFTSNKKRIVILIHGYNNSESTANKSFNRIREIITPNPSKDAFIEFHWDGLVAYNKSSSIKIWFNATGYSQLAGEFGLRRILNALSHKEILIISHSRGASVVLSALSNPPYNPKFANDTMNFHKIEVGSGEDLKENNNSINCIMLAPAIGNVDFKNPRKTNYRNFSRQLKSIQITINNTDPILKKYIAKGRLSDNFNPTDLGYSQNTYNELSRIYTIMDSTNYSGMKSHKFIDYIENPKFKLMISNTGFEL
ncbi:MAG: alpha/beta hydrolase [Balneola sp.]